MEDSAWEKFSLPFTIVEQHLDSFGHVNNAVYLQILEQARWEFIQARGFGFREVQKLRMGPTILSIHMEFLRELRLRQNVVIETQVRAYPEKPGGKTGTLVQEIFDASTRELCHRSTFKIGLFDMTLRKLIEPTADWLRAVGFKGSANTSTNH